GRATPCNWSLNQTSQSISRPAGMFLARFHRLRPGRPVGAPCDKAFPDEAAPPSQSAWTELSSSEASIGSHMIQLIRTANLFLLSLGIKRASPSVLFTRGLRNPIVAVREA